MLELKVPLLIVINKIDLINQQKVEDIMKSLQSDFLDSDIIPISAKNEFNLKKISRYKQYSNFRQVFKK